MIRDVVTLGFGLGDGIRFIPTLGFTPAAVVVVTPFRTVPLSDQFDPVRTLTGQDDPSRPLTGQDDPTRTLTGG